MRKYKLPIILKTHTNFSHLHTLNKPQMSILKSHKCKSESQQTSLYFMQIYFISRDRTRDIHTKQKSFHSSNVAIELKVLSVIDRAQ